MASSVNKVILVGRLGKDPEVRFTQGGQAVANMTLATDESYKDKTSGEKVKKTEWHRLTCWGPSVDGFIAKYLHKGDLIYVEGKLQTREWTNKENVKQSTTEINVTDIKGLVTAPVDGGQPQQRTSTNKPQARPAQRQAAPQIADDDIGF
jgi:single-strand DNA-binding protein